MAKNGLISASENLLLMDRERIRTLVKQLPPEQRAAWSKAAKAACQHLRDAKKDYGQAYVIACAMVENWRLLGADIPELIHHGRHEKLKGNNRYVKLDSLGISRIQSSRCQKLASFSDEDLGSRLKDSYDEDKYGLPSLWSISRSASHASGPVVDPAEGQYDVIVIDPPWPIEKIERKCAPNQDGFDYPTLSEEALAGVVMPGAEDCHLWCWTTQRFIPMALRLIPEWGFRYVCCFVWHKPGGFQPFGLPQYNCEFALYARQGAPKFVSTKEFPTCFNAPRGNHSEKPDAFYEMVRRVTDGTRIDMFSRRSIEGFTGWGNESSDV
ncbi:MAG: MT-A70 family methyltransferase [Gammaproteobacteria bacterium]|nr:MT-A70 family methyltransferase [Gammaproteobacteria bacterium]